MNSVILLQDIVIIMSVVLMKIVKMLIVLIVMFRITDAQELHAQLTQNVLLAEFVIMENVVNPVKLMQTVKMQMPFVQRNYV